MSYRKAAWRVREFRVLDSYRAGIVGLLGMLCAVGLYAEELAYPRRTTERILSAQPLKWEEIELVRDYENGKIVSYRWMIQDACEIAGGPANM